MSGGLVSTVGNFGKGVDWLAAVFGARIIGVDVREELRRRSRVRKYWNIIGDKGLGMALSSFFMWKEMS